MVFIISLVNCLQRWITRSFSTRSDCRGVKAFKISCTRISINTDQRLATVETISDGCPYCYRRNNSMSQSRTLQQHIEHLTEIRGILHSLKNMAFMEMHKLSKFQQAQSYVTKHIENIAADFLQFYPGLPDVENNLPSVVIVVGSERGFCGGFNESLIEQLLLDTPDIVIAVGSRLCTRLHNIQIPFTAISGANSSEEISHVLGRVTDAISELQHQHPLFLFR